MGTVEKTPKMDDIEHELHDVEDELQDFEERQVSVTRTLQMIVYPAMVAFIILSAYGFYLVQSLTSDVHELTKTISDMHTSVKDNMAQISGNMNTMTGQMGSLVASTSQMTSNIVDMNGSTQNMAGNMQQMNASTQNMAVSTYNMQRDVWSMNKNISGPMKMFNKFTPFGSDKTTPYVVPPPAVATPYYNYYGWPQAPTAQVSAEAVAASNAPATQQTLQPENGVAVNAGAPMPMPVSVETAVEAAPVESVPVVGPPTPDEGAATARDGHSAIMPEQDMLAAATAIATK
ncbi:hypothetical protein [Thiothrix nivea]|uniref:Uncharacterized protein n=1 Tax=Thiothrix nivea (strain ATCC 35100 / DSM 5205 / JP2) TaxID=870187 RepID=A0A656HHK7_THINJ|nr:hypothetical protein [Thiothrix nivea]EIJ35692.1 hypothetical protein Thini_3169 [Thiothrix nivea DSM 5205]